MSEYKAYHCARHEDISWRESNYTRCTKHEERLVPFLRSAYDEDTGKYINVPRRQTNFVTSWIDGSYIYGTNEVWLNELRSFQGGRLRTDSTGLYPPRNHQRLPFLDPATPLHMENLQNPERLFVLGSMVSNQHVPLLSVALVMFRYHNFLADHFQEKFPDLSDEQIFQSARRYLIAAWQNVILYDYLPKLLDEEIPPYEGYKPWIDPAITTEFAASAFRAVGHTVTPFGYYVVKCTECHNCTQCMDQHVEKSALCEHWFDASKAMTKYSLPAVILGLSHQSSERIDSKISEMLTEHTFANSYISSHQDLSATDILRGREFGIPDYNTVRESLNFSRKDNWMTMIDDHDPGMAAEMEVRLHAIRQLHHRVDEKITNLDLTLGGLLESRNGRIGETFRHIIREQFLRIRDSDRFWFENTQNGIFTEEDVAEIRHITFTSIVHKTTLEWQYLDDVFLYPNDHLPEREILTRESFAPNVCGTFRHGDYFLASGSAGGFVIIFLFLASIPVAHEQTGAKTQQKIQVRLGPDKTISMLSRQGAKLRIIDLSKYESVDVYWSSDDKKDSVMAMKIPKEYDMVLIFENFTRRGEFFQSLRTFLDSQDIVTNIRALSYYDTMKEAVTLEQRKDTLVKFFQNAFDQVFKAKAKQNLRPSAIRLDRNRRTSSTSNSNASETDKARHNVLSLELTKQEFADALQLKTDSIFVEKMFGIADYDKNGYISYTEFLDLIALMSKGTLEQRMGMLFHMYDIDGSNDLSRTEIRYMVQ